MRSIRSAVVTCVPMSVPVMTPANFPQSSMISLPAPCSKEIVRQSVVPGATLLPGANSSLVPLSIENVPSDNPKTGKIVALSVLATLRKLNAPLRVGT